MICCLHDGCRCRAPRDGTDGTDGTVRDGMGTDLHRVPHAQRLGGEGGGGGRDEHSSQGHHLRLVRLRLGSKEAHERDAAG